MNKESETETFTEDELWQFFQIHPTSTYLSTIRYPSYPQNHPMFDVLISDLN